MRTRALASLVAFFGVTVSFACGDAASETPTPPPDIPDAAPMEGGTTEGGSSVCGASVSVRPGTVLTRAGAFTGALAGDSYAFRGIPFAAAPTGERRFRAPEPPACVEGERTATAFGNVCPQWRAGAIVGDEDCLTLNVWTPKSYRESDRRPVLVFIHGGAHQQGSASQTTAGGDTLYDGQRFVEKSGAVMVTINYRLGPFGFLAHPALTAGDANKSSGNYGMLDQIAALKWVKENVARFGGDPSRVLVFGESAGAVSVCRLVVSPLSEALFSAALLESGACAATPLAKAEQHGVAVAKAAACDGAADVAACLRQVPAKTLAATTPENVDISAFGGNGYDGVVDGWAVPAAPLELVAAGKHHHVPIAIGNNTAETGAAAPPITSEAQYEQAVDALLSPLGGKPLVDAALARYPVGDYPTPRAAYVALTSDAKFVCTARRAARKFAGAQTEPVFRFVFSHVAENAGAALKALGATHGSELPFVFGNVYLTTQTGRYQPTAGDLAVVDAFNGYWSRFAATGDPNGANATPWARYDAAGDADLRFAAPPVAGSGYRAPQCDFWDAIAP